MNRHADNIYWRLATILVLVCQCVNFEGDKMAAKGPLTKEQLLEIRKARRVLHDWIAKADTAEKCGVECTELRQIRDTMDAALTAMEQEYGHA